MSAPRFPSVSVNCSIASYKPQRTASGRDRDYTIPPTAGDETFVVKGAELAIYNPESASDFDMSPYITTVINGIPLDQFRKFRAMGFVMPMHGSGGPGGSEKVAIQIMGLVTVKNNGSSNILAGNTVCFDTVQENDNEYKIKKRSHTPGNPHSRHIAVLRPCMSGFGIVGTALTSAVPGHSFTLSINIVNA